MDVDRVVYAVLTAGTAVTLALFVTGLLLGLTHPDLGGYAFALTAATVTLMLTPPISVAAAFAAFVSNRELSNAAVCLVVLAVMLLAIFVGIVLHVTVK